MKMHLDRSPSPVRTITFHCGCVPDEKAPKTVYVDTFNRAFCCRPCFLRFNPPKEVRHGTAIPRAL